MKKIINSIVPKCFETQGDFYFRVEFFFNGLPSETYVVRESTWVEILKDAKNLAHAISWNELKTQIYNSVVLGTAETSIAH